jgi:peptidyl-tRNA hydrolase, PTH1 family
VSSSQRVTDGEDIGASGSGSGSHPVRDLLARIFGRGAHAPAGPSVDRAIIGLGNPGPKYDGTRHNAGFMLADRLTEKLSLRFSPARGPFVIASGAWKSTSFAVAKPAGLYMNQSGTAVIELMEKYDLSPQDILVAHDDLSLDVGQIRLRAGGGSGGHNGVQDVIDELNTNTFPRLRIGIGSSFARGQQVDYVLSPFSPEQWPAVEEALERGSEAALTFVDEGLDAAMNRFNTR